MRTSRTTARPPRVSAAAPTVRYVFREGLRPIGVRSDIEAQAIGEALAEISAEHPVGYRPRDVVNAARATGHILHRYFEWADKRAAEHYREDQARRLISSIRIVAAPHQEIRAFLSIKQSEGLRYRNFADVLGNRELQLAALEQAEREMLILLRRLQDFRDIADIIRAARDRLIERRAEIQGSSSGVNA